MIHALHNAVGVDDFRLRFAPAWLSFGLLGTFAPMMIYGSTLLATNFRPDCWQGRLLRVLLFFIPRANPDHERHYQRVKKWYLELDDAGVPVREIGLDSDGRPLFGSPDTRNMGFWTDNDKAFQKDELGPVSADEFEKLWREVARA